MHEKLQYIKYFKIHVFSVSLSVIITSSISSQYFSQDHITKWHVLRLELGHIKHIEKQKGFIRSRSISLYFL